MKDKVFFSWQSDIPNSKRNLSRIIRKAIQALQREILELDMDFDRDTIGSVGALSISNVIFNKISKASIFIADITTINPDVDSRRCPNPNVLTELGFAISKLGWNRIILILDEKYGTLKDIPFDLEGHRLVKFNSDQDYEDNLTKEIKNILPKVQQYDANFNIVAHYLKSKVDILLLDVFSKITRLFLDHDYYMPQPPQETYKILSTLSDKKIENGLKSHYRCLFEVNRSYESYKSQIDQLILNLSNDTRFSTEDISIICQIGWKLAYIEFQIRRSFTRIRKENQDKLPNLFNIKNRKVYEVGSRIYELRDQYENGYQMLDKIECTSYLSELSFFDLNEYGINSELSDLILEIQILILKWFKSTGEYLIRSNGTKMYLSQ